VRTIVRENLDAELLASVRAVSGKDFRFVPAGRTVDAQVGLLVLDYPDEATAERTAKRLALRGGYFQNTVILTRFAYGRFRDQLVVAFTENAGNEGVVEFVKAFPERFKEGSARSQ
jgi:hypothetical protein